MPEFRLDSNDLLSYNSTHRVLICRECQYAIQKSAVQSHLLRHKIYRDDRQRLVFAIEQLDLLEPEDVPLPIATSPPIDGLPVIPGYRCTVPGCNSLCASIKRMKKHHSDVHSTTEHLRAESGWRDVEIQTFFRGTKLKYFEVNASLESTEASISILPTTESITEFRESGYEPVYESADDVAQDEPMFDVATEWGPAGNTESHVRIIKSTGIDLGMLSYFHHYTTATCHTLPTSVFHKEYWRVDVLALAMQQEWIMAGLLGIAACHSAVEEKDVAVCRQHLHKSLEYGSTFFRVFDHSRDDPTTEDTLAKKAGDHIACMLRCAQWAGQINLPQESATSHSEVPFDLQTLIELSRNTTFEENNQEIDQAAVFAHGREVLNNLPKPYAEPATIPITTPELRIYLLDRIRTLTWRISEILGRPASVHDVLATLSAMAALVTCCELSFASDEVGVTWRALALWMTRVPDYFGSMVKQENPTALVLIAHWTWLIKRAENSGCWFLKGVAKRVFLDVEERLSDESGGMRKLIVGIGDVFS